MIKHEKNGLAYYSFEIFQPYPRLKHAVWSRRGPRGDFNLAFSGANGEEVAANLALASQTLAVPYPAFVGQAHGAKILDLAQIPAPYAPQSPAETLQGYDALVGGVGRSALVKLADCQGALLLDPRLDVFAVIHSGWRGSALNIIGRCVSYLHKAYGSEPQSLLAAISPSLGPCCFEFKGWRESLPPELWRYRINERDYFDFWALSLAQLREAGVPPARVEIAGVCSRCGADFFSHRGGDLSRFGLMAGIIDD
ncbi:MAG: polyphenol oxidase family protein [Deltaproteobacteria bacterium]|jgi:copper oxidase (laccase) domain-containing protein|nr:polyphenol oxidase family protein [Deltaproteobacteria bacterium]